MTSEREAWRQAAGLGPEEVDAAEAEPTSAQGAPLPLSEEELAAIEGRERNATPGPWVLGRGPFFEVDFPDGRPLRATWFREDAAFISRAREDVPRLLAELRRLRQPPAPVADAAIIDRLLRHEARDGETPLRALDRLLTVHGLWMIEQGPAPAATTPCLACGNGYTIDEWADALPDLAPVADGELSEPSEVNDLLLTDPALIRAAREGATLTLPGLSGEWRTWRVGADAADGVRVSARRWPPPGLTPVADDELAALLPGLPGRLANLIDAHRGEEGEADLEQLARACELLLAERAARPPHPLAGVVARAFEQLKGCRADLPPEHWRQSIEGWALAAVDLGGVRRDDFETILKWALAGIAACDGAGKGGG